MAITVTRGCGNKSLYGLECGSAIPGDGHRTCWWCNLPPGHGGLHEAHNCRDGNFRTWEDEDATETMMLLALGVK